MKAQPPDGAAAVVAVGERRGLRDVAPNAGEGYLSLSLSLRLQLCFLLLKVNYGLV